MLRASDQGEAILVGARRREQRLPNAEDVVEASAAESELFVVVGPSPCVLRGWTGAPEGFVWGGPRPSPPSGQPCAVPGDERSAERHRLERVVSDPLTNR